MATTIDIIIPDLGDFEDVEVIEVLVKAGDTVAREDGLITLETDKAAMDVPSPENGTIEVLTATVGDKVKSGGVQTLVVPDLGDFDDVEVIEVLIANGDEINAEDPLVTLETDKAAMDVPAIVAGRIESVLVKVGDKVSKGSSLAIIEAVARAERPDVAADATIVQAPDATIAMAPDATIAMAPRLPEVVADTPAPAKQPAPQSPSRELPPINEAGFSRAHASPSVRKLARELGVDLAQLNGSGAKGRILHDDVKAFVKAILTGQPASAGGGGLPKTPSIDYSKFGEIELQPLTRIQKISGPRLQASWINLPHVTQHDLADITDLEARRQELKGPAKERGIPLTPLAFIVTAVVAALREFPTVNSSLSDDGGSLVLKKYIHIGFAADTDQGLMVPVIRDADKKDVYELATELAELSAAAREGKLKTPQLQGASFTISSLGGIGGTAFTPIVNAPEVAILGVSRSSMQPVWNGTKFVPRLMLPLSLSYDHRVVDGAAAVRFTTFLGQKLADVEDLLRATP